MNSALFHRPQALRNTHNRPGRAAFRRSGKVSSVEGAGHDPEHEPTSEDRQHLAEVERWRAHRLARLRSPDGWLAVVGLSWLREGANEVGSAPPCQVMLPKGTAHAGWIHVTPSGIIGTFDPEAGVTLDEQPVGTVPLQPDDLGDPTQLDLGSVRFFVIRRQHDLAVRVRDAESPAIAAFTGIDIYPVDRRWRFEARFEPYEPERRAAVPTVLGGVETYPVPGALAFDRDGRTFRLDAFLEPGETDLFIVFGDLTNGSETYGGGRYVYAAPPDDRGMVILDFNRAYNPPCAFTPFATCALPLPQNRLPFRVEAGEKGYRGPTA